MGYMHPALRGQGRHKEDPLYCLQLRVGRVGVQVGPGAVFSLRHQAVHKVLDESVVFSVDREDSARLFNDPHGLQKRTVVGHGVV